MNEHKGEVSRAKGGGRICSKECYCSLDDQKNCMGRMKFYRGLQKPHLTEEFVKGYYAGVEMVMMELGFDFTIIHSVMLELSEQREAYVGKTDTIGR